MKYLQIIALVILTTVVGCKDPELVGLDTINDTEGLTLQQVDTFTVNGSYYLIDSLVTSNLTTYVMGGMKDPVLGKVSSTMYTQFHLGSSNVEFPSDAVIDSVVVYLKYAGAYGKTDRFSGYQTVNVYRLNEDIDEDETYYQESTHSYTDIDLVGSTGFQPNLFDGTTISYLIGEEGVDTTFNTLELAPYLRIPLDNIYGQEILNWEAATTTNIDSQFVEVFKGLIFEPQVDALAEGSGAILYFNMPNPETRMRLYFHEEGSGEADLFDLFVGTDAATHTSFHHEYPPSILADTANEVVGEQNIIVQSLGGIGSKLSFPGLNNLTKDAAGNDLSIAINKAELVFPIEAESFSEFNPPLRLGLRFIPVDSLGTQTPLIDEIFEDPSHFGGEFDVSSMEYKFNIARQLQWFINRDVEFPEIRVLTENQQSSGYRAILNGTKHPLRPIKLRVTFTRID